MPFCSNCGAKHEEGVNFCSSCGKRLAVVVEQKPVGVVAPGDSAAKDGGATKEETAKADAAKDGGAANQDATKDGATNNDAKNSGQETEAGAEAAGFEGFFNKINDTPDASSEFDKNDAEQNKAMAILAYLGLLVLVPLLAAKDSKFARYHTNQGLIFLLCCIVSSIAQMIMNTVFVFVRLWFVAALVNSALSIVLVVFLIIGIYNAATGKAKELPIVGGIRIYKY